MTPYDSYEKDSPEERNQRDEKPRKSEGKKTSEGRMNDKRRYRLFAAIEHSYRELRKNRELNRRLVEEYAGPAFAGDDTQPVKYVNLMSQAVEAYSMLLVGNNPQAWITTMDPQLRPFANQFKISLNNLLDEIAIGETFNEWVRNAFFGVGLIKVHMADSGELIAEDDILMDPGVPFASVIALDDWVHDCTARKWSECKFEGDMYRIPFDELEDGPYDQDVVKTLAPTEYLSETGERLEEISRENSYSSDTEFEDMIDLIDVYLPRDGIIYTFAVEDRRTCKLHGKPLAEREWAGTETGPYKKLCLNKVPENVMPVPPASLWSPLDKLANNLMRKAARQAKRSKQVFAYTPQGSAGAKKIRTASDGDMIEVSDVNEVAAINFGGVDGGVNAFMLQSMELFDRMSGNLSSILGLGASADTVGQEKLIHGATSRMEESMQSLVMAASNDVLREVASLLWMDQFKVIPGEIELAGFDMRADATWTPDDREGVFSDYKIQVDVYSMNYQGPGERVMVMNQLIQQIYAPLSQMMMQQGGMIDMAELTDKYAEMLNQPALKDVIKFQSPPQQELMPGEGPNMKSPVTNRTYTRRNESAGDNSGVPSSQVPQQPEPQT